MTGKVIILTIEELMVLKEWFQVVCQHSNIEERDKNLVKRLIDFEKQFRK